MDKVQKVMELCRVCLKTSNFKMKPLFDSNTEKIVQKIKFCTGVTFEYEAGKPSQICSGCLYSLSIAHDFKTTCINSNEVKNENEVIKNNLTATTTTTAVEDEDDFDDNIDIDNDSSSPDQDDRNLDALILDLMNDCDTIEDDNLRPESIDKCTRSSEKVKVIENTESEKKKINKAVPKEPEILNIVVKNKRLQCVPCDIQFSSEEELKAHKKKPHTENIWMCEICGKTYRHNPSLVNHLLTHQPAQYKCDHCSYSTSVKYYLAMHLRRHTDRGVRLRKLRYECDHCGGRAYATKGNLREHMQRCHEAGGFQRYACNRDACGKSYNNKAILMRHLDMHDNIKRHACTVCESTFVRLGDLRKHLKKQHNIVMPKFMSGRKRQNL